MTADIAYEASMQTANTTVYPSTKTGCGSEWAIDDRVTHLRDWATHRIRPLPLPPTRECWVGTGERCEIRLEDPTGQVSRRHARLVRDEATWTLYDNESKNGIKLDGAKRSNIALVPGVEIGIGGVTLIAESARSVRLRNFLARVLGMDLSRAEVVDRAFRAVRLAATRRTALVLSGDGDLVPLAHTIHRRARGDDRPFVVCDPRRRSGEATVRSAQNAASGLEGLMAAAGGSLCVRSRRLPHDFHEVLRALGAPSLQVQLVVCADPRTDCAAYGGTPIEIPPLAAREAELDAIIQQYAAEAITELRPSIAVFPEVDCAWVRQHARTSLSEVEKATLRLVTLRTARTLSQAATMLGMAPVSLSRWIGRRGLPMELDA
jgi:pSer/pThr/pTyr-binding forkhead associated (FHA) protein